MTDEPTTGDPGGKSSFLGDRYRLIRPIGSGGMAVVWEARDEVLGRTVAVKVLAGKHVGDPQSRELIRHEARAAAALSHPNIAQVYDYGETATTSGTFPYVVMELIRGDTLQTRAASPVTPRFAMQVCAEVAAALGAAHAEGIVHRDVKPANVMLAGTGAKVVDFGIAAAVAPGNDGENDFEVLGTPAYLAPERLISDVVEPASDVYALAILLYQLLAGCLPWSSDTTTQMLTAHIWVDPEPLPPTAGVPGYVVDLCNRCLAKDPTLRPSARELAAVLTKAAQSATPTDDRFPDSALPVQAGSAAAGSQAAGSAAAGPGTAGPGTAGPGTAGPGTAGPGTAGPGTAGPGTAGPGTAGPLAAGSATAGSAVPGSTVAGSAAAGSAAAGSPVAASAISGSVAASAAVAGSLSAGSPAAGPSPDFNSIDEIQGHVGPVDNHAPSTPAPRDAEGSTPRPFPVRRWAAAATTAAALVAVVWAVWPDAGERDPAAAGAPVNGVDAVRSQAAAPRTSPSAVLSPASPGPAGRAAVTPIVTGKPRRSTATSAPAATAEPTGSAAPTTSPPPAGDPNTVYKLTSAGGTVKAICPAPSTAKIRSAKPIKPMKLLSVDTTRGPAPTAVFKKGQVRITMTVTCQAGVASSTDTVTD